MASLILCADDFALSQGTSAVIARLAAAGKVNAISCMAAAVCWDRDAGLLRALPGGVAVGLHLVLTAERALVADENRVLRTPVCIDKLGLQAFSGRLEKGAIRLVIDNQFKAFSAAMGHPPSFVDGHQHSHVLPGIREIVLQATARHAPAAWLRTCADRAAAMLRRPFRGNAFASAAWSSGMQRDARRYGLATNDSFAGHYDFESNFEKLFPMFLRSPGARHLVMCHPGVRDGANDAIGNARRHEAAILHTLCVSEIAAHAGLEFPMATACHKEATPSRR